MIRYTASEAKSLSFEAKSIAIEAKSLVSETKSIVSDITALGLTDDKTHDLEVAQSKLRSDLLSLEAYSRKNNLKFEGIPETHDENTFQLIRQKISDMGVDIKVISSLLNVTVLGHRLINALSIDLLS